MAIIRSRPQKQDGPPETDRPADNPLYVEVDLELDLEDLEDVEDVLYPGSIDFNIETGLEPENDGDVRWRHVKMALTKE
jgi:hypothetical protein